jgi:hypothetical protein
MDQLSGITLVPVLGYKVCNGVAATHCAAFQIFEQSIHVHRPVDDQKRTRIQGWQFSVDGVPISYVGDATMPRREAVLLFVMRSYEIGVTPWRQALDKTLIENRRRLDAALNQPQTA